MAPARLHPFPESELTRSYSSAHGYSRADLEDGLKWLSDRQALRRLPHPDRPRGKRGRNPSPSWEVHPDLLGLLANQGIPGIIRPTEQLRFDSAETPVSPAEGACIEQDGDTLRSDGDREASEAA